MAIRAISGHLCNMQTYINDSIETVKNGQKCTQKGLCYNKQIKILSVGIKCVQYGLIYIGVGFLFSEYLMQFIDIVILWIHTKKIERLWKTF